MCTASKKINARNGLNLFANILAKNEEMKDFKPILFEDPVHHKAPQFHSSLEKYYPSLRWSITIVVLIVQALRFPRILAYFLLDKGG